MSAKFNIANIRRRKDCREKCDNGKEKLALSHFYIEIRNFASSTGRDIPRDRLMSSFSVTNLESLYAGEGA